MDSKAPLTEAMIVTLPTGQQAMLSPLPVPRGAQASSAEGRPLLSCPLPTGATLEIDRHTGERRIISAEGAPGSWSPDLTGAAGVASDAGHLSTGYPFARSVDALLSAVLLHSDGAQLQGRARLVGENARSYAAIIRGARSVSTDKVRGWLRTLNAQPTGPRFGYREDSGRFEVWLSGWSGDPLTPIAEQASS